MHTPSHKPARNMVLTVLVLTTLVGCGVSHETTAAAPPSQTTPSSEPSYPSSPDTVAAAPSASPTGGPAGSTFAGTFNESPGGYDSSVTFSVSLGQPVETEDINDAPGMFRVNLPFTANLSVTNLTDRNAPKNGTGDLYLFFKSKRPICDNFGIQLAFGGTVQFTKPKGSYCYLTVFHGWPPANDPNAQNNDQAAPNDVYQLAVDPVVHKDVTAPNQTAVYLTDDATAKVAMAELTKGPDMMGILSADSTTKNCGVNTLAMGVSNSFFAASTPVDPVACEYTQ